MPFNLQSKLPAWGKSTYVNWNTNPAVNAVVFIHGFQGSSLSTFGDFNLDFRFRPEYNNYDVFFYGYDSLFQQIEPSGLDFQNFLIALHDNVTSLIQESGQQVTRSRQYKQIVIVAHSLGAVVTRIALNRAFDNHRRWVSKCKLVLFAPAHCGARKEIGAFIDLPWGIKFLGAAVRYVVTTIGQLTDHSIIIEPLKKKVTDLIEVKKQHTFTRATKVVWAKTDRVVVNKIFVDDPDPVMVPGKSHSAVCKPNRRYTCPFTILEEVL